MEIQSTHTALTVPKRELSEVEDELLSTLAAANVLSHTQSELLSSPEPQEYSTASPSATPEATEKKPVKKRKSWGQELPTPTTNLPPRKRAKTEAEKEQRRIERVLRNRAAAQSSRERKRKEVEALEDVKNSLAHVNERLSSENGQLSQRINVLETRNQQLMKEVQMLREQLRLGGLSPPASDVTSSPALDLLLTPTSITHDNFAILSPSDTSSPLPMDGTLDPSYLSTPSKSEDVDPFSMTQHTAVMLCPFDLPCQLTGRSSTELQMVFHLLMNWILCLAASATTLGPIVQMWTPLMASKQILHTEITRISPLIHLLTFLTTRHSLASRLTTPCATSALPRDATSSVRGFGTGAFGTDLAKEQVDNEDKEKYGVPARVCGNLEGFLRGDQGSLLQRRKVSWEQEDLMVKLAEGIRKWSEGRSSGVNVIIQPTVTVLKQSSLVIGTA